MKPNWILIASASRARLLQQDVGEPMVVLTSFDHPQNRLKASELGDDRAGQERSDGSFGGVAYEPRTDAKQKEHDRFAREIADYLEQQARQGRYRSLAMFSPSQFMGDLKAALGSSTAKLLTSTHDVDLTAVGLAEIERRIAHELVQ